MAEAISIVSNAVERLSGFLIEKAAFLRGVKKDVESLRDELMWMQSFLDDAEQRQDTDNMIRMWISEIRNIAFKAEDIIDTFSAEFKGTGPSKRKLLTSTLQKCLFISNETNVYDIGKEIKQLKERLKDVSLKRQVYGIRKLGNAEQSASSAALSTRLRDLRRTTSHADQEHFVGFDDDVQLLQTRLLSSESRRNVVSIWGMGGLGKTTLAWKIYKNTHSMFDLQAWICVSQEWNTRDLLKSIIKSFKMPTLDELNMLEKMEDSDMERYLCDLLKESRYLVVIDDMWDEEAWECLRRALPDNHNGSRIIITTRIEVVAGLSDRRTYVHKLRFLLPNESWELFCKKAFQDSNGACPQDMEEIGKQMVAKCDGLPLGIIVLGGLLSRKQYEEWHIIKNNIWNSLKDKSMLITSLLDLSYNDLSRELKLCLLYFGLFPEDHVIDSSKLIQLWVAEGFIPQEEGHDLEELGEIYLKQLSDRSLIQIVKNTYFHQLDCSIHDLLRDLVVNKAKSQDFLHIYGETSNKAFSSRRIILQPGFESYMPSDKSHHQVRTLFFLDSCVLGEDATRRTLKLIQTRFIKLRVLDLVVLDLKTAESQLELFEAMGKLIHLKYLGLKLAHSSDVIQLPESIENLKALQMLDISHGCQYILPRNMYKLKQLRHVIGRFQSYRGDGFFEPSTYFERLTNLQSLATINIVGLLRDENNTELALNAFSKLRNLKDLSVEWRLNKHKLSVEPLFSCGNLVQLFLHGSLENLPAELHEKLPKLNYLWLLSSSLEHDPIPTLEKLPNLGSIWLFHVTTNEVKSMIFGATGFPKLETMRLDDSEDMKLQVKEGAMPRLSWIIKNRFTTNNIPEKLRHLLKEL